MKFVFDGVLISTLERVSSKGDKFYSLNVDQDGEIVTLQCTPEVAKHVGQNKYQPYHFSGLYVRGEFDGRVYTRMSIVGAQLAK